MTVGFVFNQSIITITTTMGNDPFTGVDKQVTIIIQICLSDRLVKANTSDPETDPSPPSAWRLSFPKFWKLS